ncbi:hypothetical protein JKP88DRAFT_232348 [Tribonema minus]|uniref:Uncharacterized protein n=1 Tax=Tribonema minus TaxID=303371 RepID=A0A836CNW3_9STRA|nr:hypothetical protein JKP88DRAFT_232348 [Tribonema minus]
MAVPAGTQQLTLCIDDASYVTIDTFGLEPSDKGVAVAPPPNTSTIMNSAVITLVVIFGAGILIAGAVLLARRTVCKRKRAVPPEYALKDAVLAGGGGGARSRSGSGSDTPMSVASPAPSSTVLTRSASASNAAVPGMLSSTGGAPPPRHGGGGVFGAGGSMRGFSSAPYTASSVSPFIGIGPYSSGTGPYRSRSNTAGPPQRGTASRHASFSRQHSAQPSPMP